MGLDNPEQSGNSKKRKKWAIFIAWDAFWDPSPSSKRINEALLAVVMERDGSEILDNLGYLDRCGDSTTLGEQLSQFLLFSRRGVEKNADLEPKKVRNKGLFIFHKGPVELYGEKWIRDKLRSLSDKGLIRPEGGEFFLKASNVSQRKRGLRGILRRLSEVSSKQHEFLSKAEGVTHEEIFAFQGLFKKGEIDDYIRKCIIGDDSISQGMIDNYVQGVLSIRKDFDVLVEFVRAVPIDKIPKKIPTVACDVTNVSFPLALVDYLVDEFSRMDEGADKYALTKTVVPLIKALKDKGVAFDDFKKELAGDLDNHPLFKVVDEKSLVEIYRVLPEDVQKVWNLDDYVHELFLIRKDFDALTYFVNEMPIDKIPEKTPTVACDVTNVSFPLALVDYLVDEFSKMDEGADKYALTKTVVPLIKALKDKGVAFDDFKKELAGDLDNHPLFKDADEMSLVAIYQVLPEDVQKVWDFEYMEQKERAETRVLHAKVDSRKDDGLGRNVVVSTHYI